MARELELASDAAPDGQVLAVSELAAIRAGRELTRRALEATLQRQADPAEKRGSRPILPLRRPSSGQGQGVEDAVTAAGRVALTRRSPRCPAAGRPPTRLDERVGFGGFLSPRADPAGLPGRGELVLRRRLGPARGDRRPADRRRDDPPPLPPGRRGGLAAAARPTRPGRLRRRRGRCRVPHRRRDGPDPRRLARGEDGPVPGPAGRRAGRGRRLGRPRAAGARRRASPTRRWPTARRSRPAGRRGPRRWGSTRPATLTVLADGADWIWAAAAEHFPGGRAGARHLPRLPAHRRGGRRPAWRGDRRGGGVAGAGPGRAAGRRLARADGPRRGRPRPGAGRRRGGRRWTR